MIDNNPFKQTMNQFFQNIFQASKHRVIPFIAPPIRPQKLCFFVDAQIFCILLFYFFPLSLRKHSPRQQPFRQ